MADPNSLSDGVDGADSLPAPEEESGKPRKVYESNLLPDRRKRGLPPALIAVVAAAVIGIGVYIAMATRKTRAVPTSGNVAIAAALPGQHSRVWIRKSDGTITAVTPGTEDADSPAYSADGNQLTFIETKSAVRQVFVMDGDGANPIAVTTGGSSKSAPQFFPSDHSQLGYLSGGIFFTTRTDTGTADRILPPDTTENHSVQNGDADTGQSLDASKQPTILQFAFAPVKDKEHQPMAAIEDLNGVQAAAFLPTLDTAAIVSKPGDTSGRPILSSPVTTLSWSADGTKVLAAALGLTGPNGAHLTSLVPFDNQGNVVGRPITLPTPGVGGFENPIYSPDGILIAVTVWNEPDAANRRCIGLFILPADGSQAPRQIVQGDVEDIKFTPDGQNIYFRRLRADGGHDLYKVDINGSQAVKISDGTEDVTGYAVSPQG